MTNQKTRVQGLYDSILFKDVETAEVERIIALGTMQTVEQGQFVYRQWDNHGHFHLIADGTLELTMNVVGGGRHIISHIGPGGHFGETSLLTGSPNSLNARALTRLSLLSFDAETFNSVLLANPVIHKLLSIALAKRLRVSFQDHADSLTKLSASPPGLSRNLDSGFISEVQSLAETGKRPESDREIRFAESTIARQINKAVRRFSDNLEPVLLSGESGTGRRMIASEIHRASANKNGPYVEIDVRNIDPVQLEVELFGYERDTSTAFSQIAETGVLDRMQGGTVVLYKAEYMEPDCQRQLARKLKRAAAARMAEGGDPSVRARVILICSDEAQLKDGHNRLLPELFIHFAKQHFRAAPLREHRRDIPRLLQYYLKRYSLQYGKTISDVDDQTLGRFMNYDWPGNLTEMASVLQRAVLVGKNNEPLSNQIILGVPKSEGKWEFNLLRLQGVRAFVASRIFPVLPRILVGAFFILVMIALFFGPTTAEHNIGNTLSWVVGWPLLLFSFFFLARTWCSICGLSVPGWLAQLVLKPERPTPQFIRRYSGWLMSFFCILLFWIETAWNAYQSPRITAWIVFSITCCALFFSMFFKRRVWCRYLCPLGAINAIFSMPALLELRANTHMCMNRCLDHVCFNGDGKEAGCPMFRHPFLVDNNRDCILCGQCVKNCKLNSVHLNLRLAPQELWSLQSPRLEDSFLVVSLAAIFFPFAINQKDPTAIPGWTALVHAIGLPDSQPLATAILFCICILACLTGYALYSLLTARLTGTTIKETSATLGYGMIPLVLGAFMSVHLEILVSGLWLLPANIMEMAGMEVTYNAQRAMSHDTTFVLQFITIFGGLAAALYATNRIVKRLMNGRRYSPRMILPATMLLCLSAIAYLALL
ncbi:MAG: sigma 54-interacting transcriptional regulator [Desulforhopalus sp.]|nr:sigma 54-interacting transcriptional regulator [Desulforhopalus sp.]